MSCKLEELRPFQMPSSKLHYDRMFKDRSPLSPRKPYRCSSRDKSDMSKESPSMYQLHCRMCELKVNNICNTKDKVLTVSNKDRLDLNLPITEFPGITNPENLRCRCYEHHMKAIHDIDCATSPVPFPKHQKPKYVPDKLMNQVWASYVMNEQTQLPLSTLLVRWQLRRYIPSYDMKELHVIMSSFGDIAAIHQQSPNSAIVIYRDIAAACRVMQTKQLGQLRNKIHCSWWHRYMTNKSFYTTRKGLGVKVDPFIQLLC